MRVLTANLDEPNLHTLEVYERLGGYGTRLRRALLARSQIGCHACRANPSATAQHSSEKPAGLRR